MKILATLGENETIITIPKVTHGDGGIAKIYSSDKKMIKRLKGLFSDKIVSHIEDRGETVCLECAVDSRLITLRSAVPKRKNGDAGD